MFPPRHPRYLLLSAVLSILLVGCSDKPTPTELEDGPAAALVGDDSEFPIVTAGQRHACATLSGSTYCWGANERGQLGDGTNDASPVPTLVAGNRRFVALAGSGGSLGGDTHTCGLTGNGKAYCWGPNFFGQLGDGTTVDRNVPVEAAPGHKFRTIDVGPYHTCGITREGTTLCWGGYPTVNVFGSALGQDATELCDNPFAPYRGDQWWCSPTPVVVSGGLEFESISAGLWITCGIAGKRRGYCWGWNWSHQLGNGSDTDSSEPVPIAGQVEFRRLRAGALHACGLTRQGDAHCWGSVLDLGGTLAGVFNDGQLGLGTGVIDALGWFEGRSRPAPVASGLSFKSVVPADANFIHTFTCGIAQGGDAYCWGSGRFGVLGAHTECSLADYLFPCSDTPVPVGVGIRFESLAVGMEFVCGVSTDAAVYCWGHNHRGQLGDGTTTDSSVPRLVTLPAN